MSGKDSSSRQGDNRSNQGQRKGTYVQRKSSVLEGLNKVIKRSLELRESSSEIDLSEVQPWLEKVQRKGPYAVKDGRVLCEVAIPENFRGIYSARYSSDGSVIATSFGSGAIQVRKAEDGTLLRKVKDADNQGVPAMSLRFHPLRQDLFFAASACGHIYVCSDEDDQYKKFVHEKKNEVNTIDVNCAGKFLVSGGKDATLRVYDLNNGKLLLTYPPKTYQPKNTKSDLVYHKSRIFAVKFHPDRDNIFFSGGWDDVVKVWDLRVPESSECVANIRGPHICGDSIDVRGNTILTGSWTANNSIQIWDLSTSKIVDTITPHNRPQTIDGEFLYCTQFYYGDPSGNTILTGGSGTGFVEVISIVDRKIICYFKLNKTVQTIDSHYDRVVYGGMENFFRIGEYIGFHGSRI